MNDNNVKTKSFPETRDAIRAYILEKYVSHTLREYYRTKNLEFTDSALAAIIYNSGPEEEHYEILGNFAKVTTDEQLAAEILDRCRFIREKHEAFQHNDGNCVFRLETHDDSGSIKFRDNTDGIFADFETALAVGVRGNLDFDIIKHKLYKSKAEAEAELDEYDRLQSDVLGTMYYVWDGTKHVQNFCESFEYEGDQDIDEYKRFESRYVGFKFPFRLGCFVRSKSGQLGIVPIFENDEEYEAQEARLNSTPGLTRSFSDDQITMIYTCKEYYYNHLHCRIYELELVPECEVPLREKGQLMRLLEDVRLQYKKN